jgi:hypothetical protein
LWGLQLGLQLRLHLGLHLGLESGLHSVCRRYHRVLVRVLGHWMMRCLMLCRLGVWRFGVCHFRDCWALLKGEMGTFGLLMRLWMRLVWWLLIGLARMGCVVTGFPWRLCGLWRLRFRDFWRVVAGG